MGGAPDATAIVVDQAQAEALALQFERTWQRPPTREELQASLDAWIDDELLYREGLSAGLDRDDDVVRRRVAQRMASLNEGMAAVVPTQADLDAWLQAHPADYQVPPRYTLAQVYFDPQRRGANLQQAVAAARTQLERGGPTPAGDPTLLPAQLIEAPADDLARVFGTEFLAALERLPMNAWSGPVESGFGLHLVRVTSRTPARLPPLAEVRDAVERDWLRDRTTRAERTYMAALRAHYTIEVDADLARAVADHGAPRSGDGAP